MARTNNLTNFLTDVATAIKTKTGESAAIPASQFDTKITGITTGHLDNTEYTEANDDVDDILENTVVPSGTLSITENGSYDVTNYINADVNVVSQNNTKINATPTTYYGNGIAEMITNLPELDFTNVSGIQFLFEQCKNLIEIPNLKNTSRFTNFNGVFKECAKITSIPMIDTSSATLMRETFANCTALVSIPQLDTSHVTAMYSFCSNCSNLVNVPILDTSSILATSNGFKDVFAYCTSLSNESLNNIMKMCINATNYTGTKTLNFIGLTSAQATICQGLSNYNDLIAAGWTTGY